MGGAAASEAVPVSPQEVRTVSGWMVSTRGPSNQGGVFGGPNYPQRLEDPSMGHVDGRATP